MGRLWTIEGMPLLWFALLCLPGDNWQLRFYALHFANPDPDPATPAPSSLSLPCSFTAAISRRATPVAYRQRLLYLLPGFLLQSSTSTPLQTYVCTDAVAFTDQNQCLLLFPATKPLLTPDKVLKPNWKLTIFDDNGTSICYTSTQ